MRISRVVIKNFRSFELVDVPLLTGTTCVIGENNSGKTNFLHAIRLCIDANLSSRFRTLIKDDVHSSVDTLLPFQVLIGLELTDFENKINEEALVGSWQSSPGLARIFYRFRPKVSVIEDIVSGERGEADLSWEDYRWEIMAGGDPNIDMASIEWNDNVGSSIRFSDLQSFLVVFLPALRDVERDLKQYRGSPLTRLIEAMEIAPEEQQELVETLEKANESIADAETIKDIADAIDQSFTDITGPAFNMDVGLGLAEPSFEVILRALRILLSNTAAQNFDPSSNGMGLNNILYISILIQYFHRRLEQQKSAGQIILFEEPEAHLHPQLQLTLFEAFNQLPFQTVMTTHSTHITANAYLESYVTLTNTGAPAISATVPSQAGLNATEINDLERYLDATRSTLLYARKVMLVEGPAELFLIPALLKEVRGIDLDKEGISVIPIYGVHFDVYSKLFAEDALAKKCAIIADGDLQPSDSDISLEGEDELPAPPNLEDLQNDFVQVFACKTTFERATTMQGTLEMFALAAEEIGAPRIAQRLRDGFAELSEDGITKEDRRRILIPLRNSVLNTAKRFGKARFAQVASKYADTATSVPKYILDATNWLKSE